MALAAASAARVAGAGRKLRCFRVRFKFAAAEPRPPGKSESEPRRAAARPRLARDRSDHRVGGTPPEVRARWPGGTPSFRASACDSDSVTVLSLSGPRRLRYGPGPVGPGLC